MRNLGTNHDSVLLSLGSRTPLGAWRIAGPPQPLMCAVERMNRRDVYEGTAMCQSLGQALCTCPLPLLRWAAERQLPGVLKPYLIGGSLSLRKECCPVSSPQTMQPLGAFPQPDAPGLHLWLLAVAGFCRSEGSL